MESYKQEFIEFMVDSDVLKFWRIHIEKRKEISVFYECRRICDRFAALKKLGEYYAKSDP